MEGPAETAKDDKGPINYVESICYLLCVPELFGHHLSISVGSSGCYPVASLVVVSEDSPKELVLDSTLQATA